MSYASQASAIVSPRNRTQSLTPLAAAVLAGAGRGVHKSQSSNRLSLLRTQVPGRHPDICVYQKGVYIFCHRVLPQRQGCCVLSEAKPCHVLPCWRILLHLPLGGITAEKNYFWEKLLLEKITLGKSYCWIKFIARKITAEIKLLLEKITTGKHYC